MDLEGKVLQGRYVIEEKIGNGGMAVVYMAKDKVLNREVAVKILKDEFTTDSEFIKRFNDEAQSAASLTHPNIVSVYDVGTDGVYYIVMELVKGKTLKEIVTAEGKLSWKWSVNIAKQVLSALDMAHRNGIVHRDIKPHNIIITEEGIAKVTDFGIAKAITKATMTAYGSIIGSVHYFSPEHAKGGVTDAKSDLYSLGIVMYEMVTGKVPFDADTPVSVALKQVQEKPVDAKILNPSIPEGLNYIIMKAMAKSKDERYDSATEFLRDLEILTKNPEVDFTLLNEDDKNAVSESQDMQRNNNKTNIFDEKPWLKPTLTAIAIIVLLILITIFATKLLNDAREKETFIPNLTGEMDEKRKSKEEAIEELEKLGFEYEIVEEFSDDVEKGYVIKQIPPFQPNYKIKTGTKIKIFISKGPELVKLPEEMEKMSKDELTKELEKLEIKYDIEEEFSEEIEAGKIIKVEYEANDENMMPKKNKVIIKVSKGTSRKDVKIPVVADRNEADVKKELKALGLNVKEEKVVYETVSDGVVTAIDPTPGTTVKEKDTVTIFVNRLPVLLKGTVKIDVSSYIKEEDKILKREVPVVVNFSGDEVLNKKIDTNETAKEVLISGYGVGRLSVYIDGEKVSDQNVDLNKTKEITIKNN